MCIINNLDVIINDNIMQIHNLEIRSDRFLAYQAMDLFC